MALANFFGKTALAITHVLRDLDYSSLSDLIGRQVIGLVFDDKAASSFEGRITLELSTNLLSRLYPRIRLMPKGSTADSFGPVVVSIAKSINPVIEIDDAALPTAALVVGEHACENVSPAIYLGSDRWIARTSMSEPLSSATSEIPFGAATAACLGNANLFRVVFQNYLSEATTDRFAALSLIDCEANSDLNGPGQLTLTLEPTRLVGVGAIGNATVWALARAKGLSGDLHLIDHEDIELSNLQRYVLSTQNDESSQKIALAQRELSATELKPIPHYKRWGECLRDEGIWQLPCVAVAVDTAEDRQAVQAALPKFLVNAWTQTNDLGVSRHSFVGDNACLCCLYFPDEKSNSRDQIIAAAIGLPHAAREIRTLLYQGKPIGKDLLEQAAGAMGIPFESVAEFQNEPIEKFYTRAVCGGLILKLGGTLNPASLAVPLAFQSAMAGILLASEIVIYHAQLRSRDIQPLTRLDLLRPLSSKLNQPARKHYSKRCICQDPDFIQSYTAKYDGLS